MANRPLVLPFRGEQFSFSLNYKSSADEVAQIDLSAVVISRAGKLLDTVTIHKPSALDGAIVTNKDRAYWSEDVQDVVGDDVIHVLPKKLDPAAEVIVLVASAPLIPGKANDLNSSSKLEFVVSYPDDEDHVTLKNSQVTDLKPSVSAPHPSGSKGLGNGQQSIIVAVAYLDQPGWTVRPDLSTFTHDSYGPLVPSLKEAVLRVRSEAGVDLDAARGIEAEGLDPRELATFTRRWEDRDLVEAAAVYIPPPPPEGAEPKEHAPPTKLRIDIGWSTWKKQKVEGEEEEEGDGEPENTEIDFALIFYNLAGEEVQQVSSGSTEAEGVKVGREYEEPEPEEE
eukprot:CAMPEP_0202898432 /NCGR_PEP_ID=MMETSP1392-20130828/6957_1 /ASSEMBLY_ACC=CAM_ASM_000868 /TAXON_ID=225041 /ORGANISM="Chlamydomonas chlamydogama, Strain SAG 11-48b" /LENGTH=338 /DNA_ID=CAMNT_0049584357 /DNA_START=110 /DNA_END=1123 /DNA_ORIENTATION=-